MLLLPLCGLEPRCRRNVLLLMLLLLLLLLQLLCCYAAMAGTTACHDCTVTATAEENE